MIKNQHYYEHGLGLLQPGINAGPVCDDSVYAQMWRYISDTYRYLYL